jgi:hypothetical protein
MKDGVVTGAINRREVNDEYEEKEKKAENI